MYCQKCGAQLNENAIFCHNCGAAVSPAAGGNAGSFGVKMSKKDYFKSENCSEKAKGLLKANRILYFVFIGILVFTLVSAVMVVSKLTDLIDSDMTVSEFFEKLEDISGTDIGFYEEDFAELEKLGVELDIPIFELLKMVMSIVVGTIVFINLLIALFATLGVFKTSTGFAVTALVLAVIYSGGLLIIGCAIAILVITVNLNKEYKQNQMGFSSFSGGMGFNEPDFR